MRARYAVGLLAATLSVLAGGGVSHAAPARPGVAVYLVRHERVAPVRRVVPRTLAPARASLAALLRGPSAAERRSGYTSAIPGGTPLRGVTLAHGTLTVDLGGRFQAGGGSESMLLRVAQVVHTATQFPSVGRVAFRLDGRPVAAIGGEGVIVSPPVGRSAFAGQAPAILVERPLPGDRVSTPLSVGGTARVFEAQFSLDVETAAGKLLVHREVEASAGTGGRGSFHVTIPLRASVQRLVVVAYDRSPRNGARVHVVRVPVTFAPAAARTPASAPPVGPLPGGPLTTIRVRHGLLFAIALPRPAPGLAWRGARPSDWTIARPLDEGELNGNVVFTYRAGRAGSTTVVYALTRDETPQALAARFFRIVVFATRSGPVVPRQALRVRCSLRPEVAARRVVPPPPFVARIVSVERVPLPSSEPAGRGPSFKRLYRVRFDAVKGNAVLPTGHRYTQFAYVVRKTIGGRWCFLAGGSGP